MLVHNTIALSECTDEGAWRLRFFWQTRADTESRRTAPMAFFLPEPNASWVREAVGSVAPAAYYWPFGGFVVDDRLFVGLLRVVASPPRGPLRLPFRLAGLDLARVENPADPPDAWQLRIRTASDTARAIPASAFVVRDRYVYAFGFLERDDGRTPRALFRVSRSVLAGNSRSLAAAFETWTTEGRWQPGLRPERAAILMDDDASEMSVHWDEEAGRWLAVYNVPHASARGEDALTGSILLRSATRLEGPWSPPRAIYSIPELRATADGRREENLFCYAAKSHPQFARADRLLLSYVCNLYARSEAEVEQVLERLAIDPDLYRVRVVSIPRPEID